MKYSKKIWVSGFWCVVGAVLIALSFAGVVDECFDGIKLTFEEPRHATAPQNGRIYFKVKS